MAKDLEKVNNEVKDSVNNEDVTVRRRNTGSAGEKENCGSLSSAEQRSAEEPSEPGQEPGSGQTAGAEAGCKTADRGKG